MTEIVPAHPSGPVVPNEKLELLKSILADRKLTDLEFELFVLRANQAGLDPFANQIHAIRRRGRLTIQTGIDGYRLIAERTGAYAGQDGPHWADAKGVWWDVWLKEEPPAAARVIAKKVLPDGHSIGTFPAVAVWREYAPLDLDADEAFMWRKMPAGQLAKCAEALALRKAFPADLSGLYVDEEMDQAGTVTVATRDMPPAPPPRTRSRSRTPTGGGPLTREEIERRRQAALTRGGAPAAPEMSGPARSEPATDKAPTAAGPAGPDDRTPDHVHDDSPESRGLGEELTPTRYEPPDLVPEDPGRAFG